MKINGKLIQSTFEEVVDLLKDHVDFQWSVKLKEPSLPKAQRILDYSSNLEAYLRQNFNALGRGLTEKVRNIRHLLNSEDENLLLYIASERNKAVHIKVEAIDFDAFESAYRKFVKNIPTHYPDTVWDYE